MSHRTPKQNALKKAREYGALPSLYENVESIVYIPCDENNGSSTAQVLMLTPERVDGIDYDVFYKTQGSNVETPPNNMVIPADVGNIKLDGPVSNQNWFILGVGRQGALASWSIMKLGIETATKGSIEMYPGQCEINYTNGSADTLAYSTTYGGSGTVSPLLMTCDRTNDLLSIYEGSEGEAFTVTDSLGSLTSSGLVFPDLTELTMNANTPLNVSGFLFVIYDSNIPLPTDLAEKCAIMRDSWLNGIPLISL